MAAKPHRVTVTDVARAAGVSEQTVSRTVHDSPAVRAETKERVRRAMRELGYRPNFAGQSLRRGRYHTLGVVMFDITAKHRGGFDSALCQGLSPSLFSLHSRE